MSSFISVGNATQPFPRLLDAVAALAPSLPQPVFVQHGYSPFPYPQIASAAQIEMEDFQSRISAARLLILHAGAGSVINAVRAGKCPVIMPRRLAKGEHVDDHQAEFAAEMAALGWVILAPEPADLPAAIAQALARQDAPNRPNPAPTAPAMQSLLKASLTAHAARLAAKGHTQS
jgi:UDP-N-acetylglucosamine transferase subunit ALG13